MSNNTRALNHTLATGWHGALGGGLCLARVSFWRLLRSRQTVVSGMLLGFATLVVLAWSLHRRQETDDLIIQILIPVFTAFLLPIFCLCYGTASIAGDREEQTLPYLLVSPLPRFLVFAAKYVSALALILFWSVGGLLLLCQVAGAPGREALGAMFPAALAATLAYTGVFHLFSVLFRRATMMGFAYALFLETLLGSMPGIVKQITVSFYTECMIFAAGAEFGVEEAGHHDPAMYLPVSGSTALTALLVIAAATFLVGGLVFSWFEYE